MAIEFVGLSTGFTDTGWGAAVTQTPLTFSAWVRPDSDASTQTLISCHDTSAPTHWFRLQLRRNFGGNLEISMGLGTGSAVRAIASGTLTLGTWYHAAGSIDDSSPRNLAAYRDGGNKGTQTSAGASSTSFDETQLGVGLGANAFTGLLAEVGIWNAVLSDDEIASLALGYSPELIRPGNLVQYFSLVDDSILLAAFGAYSKQANSLLGSSSELPAPHPPGILNKRSFFMAPRPSLGQPMSLRRGFIPHLSTYDIHRRAF